MEEEQTERQAPEGAGSGKQKKAGKRRVFGKKGGQKREKGALTAAFAGRLLDKKWVVVGVIAALLVLSFIGLLFVKKRSKPSTTPSSGIKSLTVCTSRRARTARK